MPTGRRIAGVYVNRSKTNHETAGFLGSDPTVFYVNDTLKLAGMPFTQWQSYLFWAPLPKGVTPPGELPADLAGYNTYTSKGLIPGPICTPSVASIKAALDPGYKRWLLVLPGDQGRHDAIREDICRAPEEHPEVRPDERGMTDTARLPTRPTLAGRRARPTGSAGTAADRAARPERLARLRARMAAAGVDAYLGVRAEHSRYLTGLVLGDGEEKVAGVSGWFVVGPAEVVLFADSRYTIQVGREAPERPDRAGLRRPRLALAGDPGQPRRRDGLDQPSAGSAVEAGFVSHATGSS